MTSLQRSMANKAKGKTDKVDLQLDAVVIGGGFAGVYLLYKLRKEGFNVKLIEAGDGLGGIWHWNNSGTEQYPGSQELQRYFQHMDNVLDISKDTIYNTRVNSATWDDSGHVWNLECDNGTSITTRFMHCCLGFAAKRHFPDWSGLEDYQGYLCHSSFWPVEGIDMKGKRMAVIGNGATGIQIAQTAARDVDHLGVYIRTPNITIPMNQQPVDEEKAKKDLETMGDRLGRERYLNAGGFLYDGQNKNLFDDPPEKRDAVLKECLDYGGFKVLHAYNDILLNEKANRYVYDTLNKRTRARMTNEKKKNILAPIEPPHPFAGKRPSLEQDYYEQMDKDHVEIIDLKSTPVSHVTKTGIMTTDGTQRDYDIIAIATGFDSLTGGFMEVDFTGVNGEKLDKKWNGPQGAWTYLGMTVAKFPNMFFTYGPQAPTAYANGPSVTQPQGDWITDVMLKMKKDGKTKIDAKEDAEKDWKKLVDEQHSVTLRHNLEGSWYMGTNIPGKPRQVLNYSGGIPLYLKTIREVLENDLEGFVVS